MKRVLCVVSSLNAGGAETFLMKVFRTIDRSKYMFDFIVSADGIYEEEVLELGGKIFKVSLRTKNPLKVFNEIRTIVKENQYHYFFKLADTPLAGLIDILAAKLGGAKWISVRSCNASTNSSKITSRSDGPFVDQNLKQRVSFANSESSTKSAKPFS